MRTIVTMTLVRNFSSMYKPHICLSIRNKSHGNTVFLSCIDVIKLRYNDFLNSLDMWQAITSHTSLFSFSPYPQNYENTAQQFD